MHPKLACDVNVPRGHQLVEFVADLARILWYVRMQA